VVQGSVVLRWHPWVGRWYYKHDRLIAGKVVLGLIVGSVVVLVGKKQEDREIKFYLLDEIPAGRMARYFKHMHTLKNRKYTSQTWLGTTKFRGSCLILMPYFGSIDSHPNL
jgi:hypothetical protein